MSCWLAGLPKGLEPDQVRRLLAACDVDTAVGCRDLAILTLLVRFGLRRGEVARLRLDDIDWRAGTISVHGKGNCYEQVPLPPDVGYRVAEYLQHGRPTHAKERTVFVRHLAPHHALSTTRVSTIVADVARRAGLGRVHAHRLRHTAQEIADLMRATAILRGSHVQATYRTLIGLLAVSGMRIGEAIGLDRDDFDAGSGMVSRVGQGTP